MTNLRTGIALIIGLMLIGKAAAQTTAPPPPIFDMVGKQFESLTTGIAMRPPLGSKTIRGALGSNEVVRFTNEDKKWVIKVSRVLLEEQKPLPLTLWKGPDGRQYPGLLELTIEQFKSEVPGAQILRQDTTVMNQTQMGLLAAKYDFGTETNLSQQAVIPRSDIQYYIIAMSSPAPRNGEIENDADVRKAAETFRQVLESVQFLDQTPVKEERDERLLRTRGLYVNLTETRLRQALRSAQWLRILKAGKDIGYSYIVEEIARDLPRKGKPEASNAAEGVLIGIRTRVIPEAGSQINSESWLFSAFPPDPVKAKENPAVFNRKYEAFSNISYLETANSKVTSGDLGVSRWRQKLVNVEKPKNEIGAITPDPIEVEDYRLEVTRLGRNVSNAPVTRPLPPYYLPQALQHLLPRIIDRREQKTYAFAVWVPEAAEVMFRYVDVLGEQESVLGNRRIRAITIKDRLGIEGPITMHYVSSDGQYLGSVNEETQITTIATDAATLQRLWKDANLQRPGDVEGR